MGNYILRRLALYIPTLIGVSIIIFLLLHVVPGDPALMVLNGGFGGNGTYTEADIQALRHDLGFDKPLLTQYTDWVSSAIRGDFGSSLRYNQPVSKLIAQRILVTAELGAVSVFLALLLGIPLGMISAMRRDTTIDHLARIFAVLGLAVPNFWLGLLVLLALVNWFGWLPPLGYVPFWVDPIPHFQIMIWPAAVLGSVLAAYIARMTRAQLLEVLQQDYIRTAYSKGLTEKTVTFRHALKNALPPVVTLSGLQLGALISGTVVIEVVFSIPGMGRLLVNALEWRDYPTIQAIVLVSAIAFVTVNLIVDLLYPLLDPRIQYR
jgi:peptide/nickel transport system permease protein